MYILFIDTNAYLHFYKVPKTKDLLETLNKQRAHIFVTRQIANEVKRNALPRTIEMVGKAKDVGVELPGFSTPVIPDILNEDREKAERLEAKARDLKKTWEKLKASAEALNRDLQEMIRQVVEAVATSNDRASQVLDSIFRAAVEPSDQAIERARFRRETGNPPGKKGDPLGDQLNWEQLLERLAERRGENQDVWIISTDRDYMIEYNKKWYLDALLFSELKERCGSGKISCFTTLVEGITHFAEATSLGKDLVLPGEKQEEIRIQEEDLLMQNAQETPPVPPPTFSVAAVLRHRLSLAESHGDTVPLHFFNFSIPPGAACEPELRQIVDEFNREAHVAGRSASHGRGARTQEQIRQRYLNLIIPILRDHLQKAEAIEARRTLA